MSSKKYYCEYCDYHATSKNDLNRHERSDRHKINISYNFMCDSKIINEQKKKISKLKNVLVKTDTKYNCEYCGYTTDIKGNLEKHEQTQKHKFNIKNICNITSKITKNETNAISELKDSLN